MTDKRWFVGIDGQIVVVERDVHDNSAIVRRLDLGNLGTFWNMDLGGKFAMPNSEQTETELAMALEKAFPDIREIKGPEHIPVIFFPCLSHEELCEQGTSNVWAVCDTSQRHLSTRLNGPMGKFMPIRDVPSGTTLCGSEVENLFRLVHGNLSLKDNVYLGPWAEAAKFRACEIVQMRIMHPDRWTSRESALSDYFAGHDFTALDKYRLAHCYLGKERSFKYLTERMYDCSGPDKLKNIQRVLDISAQLLATLPTM